jgi:hypothetical protein
VIIRKEGFAAAAVAAVFTGLLYPYFKQSLTLINFIHPGLLGALLSLTVAAAVLTALLGIGAGRPARIALLVGATAILCWFFRGELRGEAALSMTALPLRLFVVALLSLCILLVLKGGINQFVNGRGVSTPTLISGIFLVIAFAVVFSVWFSRTNFVWFWDYSGYEQITLDLVLDKSTFGLVHALHQVRLSIAQEYNSIPAVPLAAVELLLGRKDRMVLIVSIAVLYVSTSMLMMAYALHRLSDAMVSGRMALLVVTLSCLAFPVIFYSPLYGMPDIGGVAIVASIACSLKDRRDVRERAASLCLSGMMVVLLCIFRRWYAFIAVPLVALKIIVELTCTRRKFGVVQALEAIAIFGAGIALPGFAFYWDRLLVVLQTGYSAAYEAYSHSTPVEIANAAHWIGFGPIFLAVLSLIYLALVRQTRWIAFAALGLVLCTAGMFLKIQGFASQHYLLVLPVLALCIGLAAVNIYCKSEKHGYVVLAGLFIFAMFTLCGVLYPAKQGWAQQVGLLPGVDMSPTRRGDMPELTRLVRDLEAYAVRGKSSCVAASGVELNQSIIIQLAKALDDSASQTLVSSVIVLGDVDRRDGPAVNFQKCDYVVVTDPLNKHLAEQEQQVVLYLAKAIELQQGLGVNYRRTGQTYSLDHGYKASVYERVGTISQNDWADYLKAVEKK